MQTLQPPLELDAFTRQCIRRQALRLLGRARLNSSDRADLEQELTCEWLSRRRHFDPTVASSEAFTTTIVKHCAASIMRLRRAEKRDCERVALDVTHDGEHEESSQSAALHEHCHERRHACCVRAAGERNELALDVAHVVSRLPPELRRLCAVLQRGDTVAAAAAELSVPRTTLNYAKRRIRAHFVAAGLDLYL